MSGWLVLAIVAPIVYLGLMCLYVLLRDDPVWRARDPILSLIIAAFCMVQVESAALAEYFEDIGRPIPCTTIMFISHIASNLIDFFMLKLSRLIYRSHEDFRGPRWAWVLTSRAYMLMLVSAVFWTLQMILTGLYIPSQWRDDGICTIWSPWQACLPYLLAKNPVLFYCFWVVWKYRIRDKYIVWLEMLAFGTAMSIGAMFLVLSMISNNAEERWFNSTIFSAGSMMFAMIMLLEFPIGLVLLQRRQGRKQVSVHYDPEQCATAEQYLADSVLRAMLLVKARAHFQMEMARVCVEIQEAVMKSEEAGLDHMRPPSLVDLCKRFLIVGAPLEINVS
jgi:hypothetical protein